MNCTYCQNYEDEHESIGEGDENKPANANDNYDQEVSNRGGFTGLASCLHKVKSSEKQVDYQLFTLARFDLRSKCLMILW